MDPELTEPPAGLGDAARFRTTRWSLKRRLDGSERQLADMRALANRPVEPTPASAPAGDVPPAPTDLFSTDKP